MYGLTGGGLASDDGGGFGAAAAASGASGLGGVDAAGFGDCDGAGFGGDSAAVACDASASGFDVDAAGAPTIEGLASLRCVETRGGGVLEVSVAFLAVAGSALKTWPHREHLNVGMSAGRTRSSMR